MKKREERGSVRCLEQMKPAVRSKVNRLIKDFRASITAAAQSNSNAFISKIAGRIGKEDPRKKSTRQTRHRKHLFFIFCLTMSNETD